MKSSSCYFLYPCTKVGEDMQDILKKERQYKRSFLLIMFISLILKDCLLPVDSQALIGIKEGDAPKNIVLTDINGKRTDISALFGKKPVILVFWELPLSSTFLDYSKDELNFLRDFYGKYNDKNGLEIFAIYTPEEENVLPDSEISLVKNLMLSNKINFPVLIDNKFQFFREYGIIALPTTIMINKAGKIQFIYPSFPLAGRPIVSKQIRKLVGITSTTIRKEKEIAKGHDSHAIRLYRYALQMYKKDLVEQSLSPLTKSMDIDPYYSWAHNLKGIIQWEKGSLEQAAAEFKKAIELDNNLAARLNYTVLLIEKGAYDDAEELLVKSPISHSYFKLVGHYLLGYLYKETKKTDEAIRELEFSFNLIEEESYAIDRSTPRSSSFRISILHDLSLLYGTKGNEKKARELLHQAFHYLKGLQGDPFTEGLRQIKHLMIYE